MKKKKKVKMLVLDCQLHLVLHQELFHHDFAPLCFTCNAVWGVGQTRFGRDHFLDTCS